jgi:DNA-nicking Smr family endonuclease
MNNDDDSDFADMVPGVKRLRQDRINVYRQREPGSRKSRVSPPQESRSPSGDDPLPPGRESHFNPGLQKKLQRRIRQGLIRPQASLDLHGCRRQEALDLLEDFIDDALRRGRRMLIVIHGQGFRSQSDAVLKPLVRRWLGEHPAVLAWCPAQPRDGAAGASYVYLRGNS